MRRIVEGQGAEFGPGTGRAFARLRRDDSIFFSTRENHKEPDTRPPHPRCGRAHRQAVRTRAHARPVRRLRSTTRRPTLFRRGSPGRESIAADHRATASPPPSRVWGPAPCALQDRNPEFPALSMSGTNGSTWSSKTDASCCSPPKLTANVWPRPCSTNPSSRRSSRGVARADEWMRLQRARVPAPTGRQLASGFRGNPHFLWAKRLFLHPAKPVGHQPPGLQPQILHC